LHWRNNGRAPVVHGVNGSMRPNGKTGSSSPNFPYAAMERLSAGSKTLDTLFGYAYSQSVNLVIQNRADSAGFVPVTGNFFSSLGIRPAAGRLIGPDDDRAGAPLVAALSYDYWKKRFNENPEVVGQTILADNMPIAIVGVCAPG